MSAFLHTFALAAVALASQTAPSPDPCLRLISAELAKAVTARFPSYRLPTVKDSLPFEVEYEKQHGGDGCLVADRGDFNADGQQDFALLLPSRDAPDDEARVILVAALTKGAGWNLNVLRNWGGSAVGQLYVSTVPPGRYLRTEAIPDPPAEPGEVEMIESRSVGIATGVSESSRIVYFLEAGCWKHVWVSD